MSVANFVFVYNWLIKPFPEGTRDHEEMTFNKELSSARVTVKQVFGILRVGGGFYKRGLNLIAQWNM